MSILQQRVRVQFLPTEEACLNLYHCKLVVDFVDHTTLPYHKTEVTKMNSKIISFFVQGSGLVWVLCTQ